MPLSLRFKGRILTQSAVYPLKSQCTIRTKFTIYSTFHTNYVLQIAVMIYLASTTNTLGKLIMIKNWHCDINIVRLIL